MFCQKCDSVAIFEVKLNDGTIFNFCRSHKDEYLSSDFISWEKSWCEITNLLLTNTFSVKNDCHE